MMKFITFFLLLVHLSAVGFVPEKFSAKLEQKIKSELTGKEKTSLGKITYLYPSHLKIETFGEDPIIYVSNPRTTWYYRAPFIEGEPGDLTISEKQKDNLVQIFDLLKEGLKNNRYYEVIRQKNDKVLIKFKPQKAKQIEIIAVELSFKNSSEQFSNLSLIEIFKPDQKSVYLTFSEIVAPANLSKEDFIFIPPKNTKVSK